MNTSTLFDFSDSMGLIAQEDFPFHFEKSHGGMMMPKALRRDAPAPSSVFVVDDVLKSMKVNFETNDEPVGVDDFDFMSSGSSSPGSAWSESDEEELDMLLESLEPMDLPEPLGLDEEISGDIMMSLTSPVKKKKKRKRSASVSKKKSIPAKKARKVKTKKPRKPKLSPEERAALKHSRMLARRQRKNIREKKRRIEEKALFEELCGILNVRGQTANEKGFILAATLRSVRALQAAAKASN